MNKPWRAVGMRGTIGYTNKGSGTRALPSGPPRPQRFEGTRLWFRTLALTEILQQHWEVTTATTITRTTPYRLLDGAGRWLGAGYFKVHLLHIIRGLERLLTGAATFSEVWKWWITYGGRHASFCIRLVDRSWGLCHIYKLVVVRKSWGLGYPVHWTAGLYKPLTEWQEAKDKLLLRADSQLCREDDASSISGSALKNCEVFRYCLSLFKISNFSTRQHETHISLDFTISYNLLTRHRSFSVLAPLPPSIKSSTFVGICGPVRQYLMILSDPPVFMPSSDSVPIGMQRGHESYALNSSLERFAANILQWLWFSFWGPIVCADPSPASRSYAIDCFHSSASRSHALDAHGQVAVNLVTPNFLFDGSDFPLSSVFCEAKARWLFAWYKHKLASM